MKKNSGFTLIEMSIVLVIIGLIIGGILVGRDLIKASEVTAQISQISKYSSAVNTFKNKYGGLPGDLNISLANQFGFTVGANCNGGTAFRDGNGLIDGWGPPAPLEQGHGETALFWQDISAANLIDVSIPNSGGSTLGCSATATTATATTASEYFPIAKIGYGNFVYVYETGGNNWFGVSAITSVLSDGAMFTSPLVPVIAAYNMDKKIDDGLPTTGVVQATYVNFVSNSVQTAPSGPADTTSTCYSGTTGSYVYSLSATANQGAGLNCALSFRFQ